MDGVSAHFFLKLSKSWDNLNSILEKMNKSYLLLCTETTLSNHPVVIFWVKYQKLLKVEIIWIPFSYILEKINRNYDRKYFFGYHDVLKIYGAPKLCSVMY